MSVESVSSDKPDPKDEGDEAIISMSVAGEVTDSSIVEVGRSRPQFQYTREELMEIKVAPLSKRRPDCLDSAYNNKHGIWDPERWHLDRKRSETPPEDEPANRNDHVPENHAKRRSGDPRERIRKEQDGIVLSPQRRSFNSGCFVNVSQPPPRRPESPLGKAEVPHREPVRRIGSGRILNRDMWDFRSENDKLDSDRSEFSFRPGGGGPLRDRDNRDNREAGRGDPMRDRDNIRDRDDRNDRYERRSFGRDFGDRDRGLERNERNQQNDRDKDRGRDRRYGNDRRRTYSDQREIEEPEWFSSGPTSQHDTIELRGFEDIPEEKINNNTTKGKKQSPAQKKRAKKAAEKEEKQNENHSAGPKGRSTPNSMEPQINVGAAPHSPILEQNEQQSPHPKEKSEDRKTTSSEQNSNVTEKSSAGQNQETKPPDFNLDDFLKSDTFPGVPGLLTNGVGSNGGAGSRFSQWFKRESPVQQLDSRKPSIQDELLNNLLNDISEPKIKIPSVTESNAYFAPISPANTTNHAAASTAGKFIEMLQRGNKANQNGQGDAENPVVQMMKNSTIKDAEQSAKPFLSLEELEARMRGGPPPPVISNEPPRITKTDEDLSAFKKLLAQVTGGQAVPAANGPIPQKQQPFTLMQFINTQLKSQTPIVQHQNPEPMRPPTFNHVGPLGPVQHPHQSQLQHENLMKVLQVQQQQQQQQQQQKQRQEQQQMLSMMMGGQRMMGVSPIPPDVQMMVNCAPATRELLQRPEAQAIIHGLQQGEITRQHLVQQLQNPAMQHRHREVLVNILKVYGGTTPRTVSPHASAPTPQDHMLQQMLYQQQQQQQRIPSPMNNVIPHRVPSPREIAMHTQTIIQNALIKKKLEEQRENFRKRQEQQQQHHQQQKHQPHPNAPSPVNSPAKQTQSPTPLAFTPTSVLRKMTAEKEPEGSNDLSKMVSQNPAARRDELSVIADFAHQVALVAAGESRVPPTRSQPPVHPTWQNPAVKQHPGRPIVKGGSGTQFQYSGNIDFQQQQQQQRATPGMYGNPTARSKHTMAAPLPHPNVPQFNVASNSVMGQRSNQMTSQMKAQQVQSHLVSLQQQQQQQQRTANPQIQLALNQNYNSSRNDGRVIRPQQLNIGVGRQTSPGLGFLGSTGGDLSPTSNQLARWFSPELLAQARAGKLPELGQTNLLSVEELERLQHASTTVHN